MLTTNVILVRRWCLWISGSVLMKTGLVGNNEVPRPLNETTLTLFTIQCCILRKVLGIQTILGSSLLGYIENCNRVPRKRLGLVCYQSGMTNGSSKLLKRVIVAQVAEGERVNADTEATFSSRPVREETFLSCVGLQ